MSRAVPSRLLCSLLLIGCAGESGTVEDEGNDESTTVPDAAEDEGAQEARDGAASTRPRRDAGSARDGSLDGAARGAVESGVRADSGGDAGRVPDGAGTANHDAGDARDAGNSEPPPSVDGGAGAVAPSAGCGKGGRPSAGVINQGTSIYQFPSEYDGSRPLPLVVALHAAGNPNTQIRDLTRGSELADHYVMIFPKSAGSAWNYASDKAVVDADIERLTKDYCIDTRRIFGTGHSSGAQMLVQMLCNGEKRLRGVAPVAASKYCKSVSAPVLYIQGKADSQRGGGNGSDVVATFAAGNGCSTATVPDGTAGCASMYNKASVTPACVSYQGCNAPTHWCSHDDGNYGGTNHGWPCFATSRIHAFFETLK